MRSQEHEDSFDSEVGRQSTLFENKDQSANTKPLHYGGDPCQKPNYHEQNKSGLVDLLGKHITE